MAVASALLLASGSLFPGTLTIPACTEGRSQLESVWGLTADCLEEQLLLLLALITYIRDELAKAAATATGTPPRPISFAIAKALI